MPTGSGARTTLRESAAKGVGWSLIQSLGSRLLSTVTFVVLARLLTPQVFGVVAFASVAVAFLTVFVQQGFGPALVQVPELEPRHKDTAFWISLGFGCVFALAGIAGSWPLAAAVGVPAVGPVLAVLSLGFVLSGLSSAQQALLQRRMAFRSLAIRQTLANFVGAVIGITCAALGAGVWSLVAQTLSAAAVGVVVLWRATGWRPGLQVSRATYVELFRFSRNVTGSSIMSFFNRRSDDFFIGAVLGPALLGVYTVAYRLLTIMIEVSITTVATVALPTFSRLQSDVPRLRKAYFTATQISAAVAMPMFLFMAVAAPEVIQVFFGPRWAASAGVMRVLALFGVATTLTNFNATVLSALGRPDLVLRFMVIGAVCNVIGVAVAVHWGILAVAWWLVARNWLISTPLSISYITRYLDFSVAEYFRQYVAPLLASAAPCAFALAVHVQLGSVLGPLPRLAVMVVGAALCYLGSLRLLDRRLFEQAVSFGRAIVGRRRGAAADRPGRRPGDAVAAGDLG